MRLLLPAAFLFGCSDKVAPSTDTPTDSPSTDTADTDTGTAEEDFCSASGLTVRPFDGSGGAGDFDTVVPDFSWSVRDIDGVPSTWTFSEEWSGCDSYIIINYYASSNYPVELDLERDIMAWLEASPRNVHYFFFSYDQDAEAALEGVMDEIGSSLGRLDEALADHWRERLHVVDDSPWEADWVGALNSGYYVDGEYVQWGLSIDRFGVAREIGYLCDPTTGWATCPPEFMAYEPEFYNFESDRQDQLDAEQDVTIVNVWTEEPASDTSWAGVRIYADVDFPDAATMETFDTMAFDLTLQCAAHPDLVNCPPWDYLVYAYLCEIDDPNTAEDESEDCSTEIGRWITTYWRPGRWIHDVTPFLAMLQDGGTRRFAFYTTQYYDVSLDVRLSNQGKGARPVAMEPLYTGGYFYSQYNWGVNHEISASSWRVWNHETYDLTYAVSTINEEDGYLTAERDGDWHRFDWTSAEDGVYYCHTADSVGSEKEAEAVVFSCVDDDPKTKEDESACTGANPDDLKTGCNEAAWAALEGDGADLWGEWQEIWHEGRLPRTFTPPEGTKQVGLAAIITGHGGDTSNGNCAEFCDHQHEFTFNDTTYRKEHPAVGELFGCAEEVRNGVVPNQAGTWVYGRGGWCPGQEVQPWVVDVTDDVTIGAENTVSYIGLKDGSVWTANPSGSVQIRMNSYLVYYE